MTIINIIARKYFVGVSFYFFAGIVNTLMRNKLENHIIDSIMFVSLWWPFVVPWSIFDTKYGGEMPLNAKIGNGLCWLCLICL